MALTHSSVIVTAAATDTRTRDQLSFVFTARPQAMSVYIRFVEAGTCFVSSARLLQISSAANGNPRFIISNQGSGIYQVQWLNSAGTSKSSVSTNAVSFGNMVELLATLSSTGVVQLSQSINGGTINSYTASAAQVLPDAWGGQLLWVNSVSTTGVGLCAFRNIEIMAGVQTMQAMRVRAGTD